MKKVLMVTTSHSQLGSTEQKTGLWLSELTHPYYHIHDDNTVIDIVSIKGGAIPLDPNSQDADDDYNKKFLADETLKATLENSQKLSEANIPDYDAIVFAGGHGTMWDFADNQDVIHAIEQLNKDNKIIGAICHGVSALINPKDCDGNRLIDGKATTAFSNEEEAAIGLTDVMPFSLENALTEQGADYSCGAKWQSHVAHQGNIVTGQNPQSAMAFGNRINQLLKA